MTVTEVVIGLVAATGVFFAVIAAIGLLRFPDVYTRTHAASQSETLGAVLALTAVALTFGADLSTVKTVLLLLFMFVTNPTAAHAVVRAAHDEDIEPYTGEEES